MTCSKGGVVVTVNGLNFGDVDTPSEVFIGTSMCSNVIHNSVTPHSQITCVLHNGTGYDLNVIVQVNGQRSTPRQLISYAGPEIFSHTLYVVVNGVPVDDFGHTTMTGRELVLNTTVASDIVVCMRGKHFGNDSTAVTVRAGNQMCVR